MGELDHDRHLLAYAAGRQISEGAAARVVHVVVNSGPPDFFTLETVEEAAVMVSQAVACLEELGGKGTGGVEEAPAERAGLTISEAAVRWGATAIVLSGPRRPGRPALLDEGVREQVLRHSWRPAVLVPAPLRPKWPPVRPAP